MTKVTCYTEISFDISDIDDEDFEKEYKRRSRNKQSYSWAHEVYRMIAEGRTEDAMHEMHRHMPDLAPPLPRAWNCRPPHRKTELRAT
jgi:pyridoxine/pyridoxamine 5'-phosphate oxidase